MSKKFITYNKPPFDRMKMVDLVDETEEMQWAILDYHNQDFVLNNIVDNTVFTCDDHKAFLEKYPSMKRRQYIVYYNCRAIGKVSFTPLEDGIYDDLGYYLFHKKDLHKKYGLLMVSFVYHYIFDILNARKIKCTILPKNISSQRLSLSLGCKIVKEDNKLVYLECLREDYQKSISNIDEQLNMIFG